jgi:hypothetical protein
MSGSDQGRHPCLPRGTRPDSAVQAERPRHSVAGQPCPGLAVIDKPAAIRVHGHNTMASSRDRPGPGGCRRGGDHQACRGRHWRLGSPLAREHQPACVARPDRRPLSAGNKPLNIRLASSRFVIPSAPGRSDVSGPRPCLSFLPGLASTGARSRLGTRCAGQEASSPHCGRCQNAESWQGRSLHPPGR